MVVYVDALIIVNFMIDFIIIRLAALFVGIYISVWKCALGAFLGALSSLIVFAPDISPEALFLSKLAVCIVMAVVSFAPVGLPKLFKLVFSLLSASFIISGLFSFAANTFMRDKMSVYRGVVYFDIGLPAMLLSVTAAYVMVRLLSEILKDRLPAGSDCRLTVFTLKGSCCVDAIIDTGCRVTEPFSGEPVIICDGSLLKEILPADFLKGTNFRLVPFNTVNSTGMLRAFRSEYVLIRTERNEYRCKNVFVAMGELGSRAIVNPAVLNDAEREGVLQN